MKTLVRIFVVALAFTGAVASTQISTTSAQTKIAAARTSSMPIPTCPPDDPNACGIDQ